MVMGLERFRVHFEQYSDRYLLIGGTACELVMNAVGVSFRATKDLDIVLCMDSVDAEFARAFWDFVEAGGYKAQESAEGRPRFYRFHRPAQNGFPAMLELFSRAPEALPITELARLTPIPVNGEISSLSAILLDEEYYNWLNSGRRIVEGLPVVGPEYLIPLKARAWLDLRARRLAAEHIDTHDIRKHLNDVFRLFQILAPQLTLQTPAKVGADMREFLHALAGEDVDLRKLGLKSINVKEVIESLGQLYREQQ